MIHLYCLAVQAGFYSGVVRVLDLRSEGPQFYPRPGHRDFSKSPCKMVPTGGRNEKQRKTELTSD